MAMKMLMLRPSYNLNNLGDNQPSSSHSFWQVFFPKQLSIASCATIAAEAATAIRTHEKSNISLSNLANIWREIQGSNNWNNLVEPLHPLLRQEIVRYGEFVTACYKAFDLDPNSKRFLSCKYGKNNMLQQVGMENSGYEVNTYIYASPDINLPIQNGSSYGRWIGYVAVSSDDAVKKLGRRDILITFRGTVTNREWVANLMSSLTPARLDPNDPRPGVKVESGFLSLYTSKESDNKFGLQSCRQQLLSEVSRLLYKYRGEDISITLAGHSMGSSLALLLAYDISELGLNKVKPDGDIIPVTVFSFGGPRVGNVGFKERCEELGVKVLRIVNVNDPITKLPGVLLNENFRILGGKYEFPWSCSCYAHVGIELVLDFFNIQNPSYVHDLEAYIDSLLMKCSESIDLSDVDDDHDDDEHRQLQVDYFNKAKELLMSAEKFQILRLGIAMNNFIDYFQSERTEFLFDEYIYIWMSNLALYFLL